MNMKLGIAGRFRLEAYNPETGKTRVLGGGEDGWFPNLILNQGMDQFGLAQGGPYLIPSVQVGSGNTTPAVTQVGLATFVAGTSNLTVNTYANSGTPLYYASNVRSWQFAQGAAAGNLSEIGAGSATTGNTLFSRALILDGGGNPTTITVLAIEFLTVTYEVRLYPPLTDTAFNITISGVSYACVMRAMLVGSWTWPSAAASTPTSWGYTAYSGALGAVTGQPSGQLSGFSTGDTLGTYSGGSYFLTQSGTFPVNNGNGNIAAVHMGKSQGTNGVFYFQCSFSPTIPKDNTKTLSLTCQFSWSRKTLP